MPNLPRLAEAGGGGWRTGHHRGLGPLLRPPVTGHGIPTADLSGEGDLSHPLSIAVEGIFRGVGMERVIFAMLTPDRRRLPLRYGLGKGLPAMDNTLCHVDPAAPNLLSPKR
ncbi:hypothetical protein [Endothiovibrio diazotrophicus]